MKFDFNSNQRLGNTYSGHQISQFNFKDSRSEIDSLRNEIRAKRFHKLALTFGLILAELLVMLLLVYYPISPLNHISQVSIHGNQTISTLNIMKDMRVKHNDSVLMLLGHEHRFKDYTFRQNAQVKSIHVAVSHFNHVRVNLSEYPTVAYLNQGHHYFAVVENGRMARQYTSPDLVKPVLRDFKSPGILSSFVKSYRRVPDSVKPDIEKIDYTPVKSDPARIHVYMSDGNQVYADFDNWDRKMKYYPAIAKSMKKRGVINIELGAYSKAFKSNRRR